MFGMILMATDGSEHVARAANMDLRYAGGLCQRRSPTSQNFRDST